MKTLVLLTLMLIFIATPSLTLADVTIKATTDGGQEVVLVTLSATDIKALRFKYGEPKDIVDHFKGLLEDDINRAKEKFVRKWIDIIQTNPDGATTIPLDFDTFVDMVTQRPDYTDTDPTETP